MKKIIVTFTDNNNNFSYELELPTEVRLIELYSDIADTLNKANREKDLACPPIKNYAMYSKRSGKYLMPEDTFQSAKVYSGDSIIIDTKRNEGEYYI